VLIWDSTHKLDPYRPLESQVKPIQVDVIALNWKWLFIYPEYGVASLNQLAIPVGTPVNFRLTAESMMNSFFIPQLGSMLYA
ncbi:cytochrome ubiquinol oxidase subunit II, partial [Pseudomonas sp. GW460-13]